MAQTKRLSLVFATDAETTFSISLDNPNESLRAEQVMMKMEAIVEKGVLMDAKGNDAIGAHSAAIISTEKTILF